MSDYDPGCNGELPVRDSLAKTNDELSEALTKSVNALAEANRITGFFRQQAEINARTVREQAQEIEKLQAIFSRHMKALDIIANSEFEMKMGEAMKLVRRTAYEALKGGDQWHEKKVKPVSEQFQIETDSLGLTHLTREELLISLRAWIASNATGGWIDNIRCELARYESGRVVLTGMVDDLNAKLSAAENEVSLYESAYRRKNAELANVTVKLHQVTLERDAMLERVAEARHQFKNFHRMLCERFDYCHDEKDWQRDQVSLMEWIAARTAKAVSRAECSHGQLARQCPLCEKDAEIERLKVALRDLWRIDSKEEWEDCPDELAMRVKGLIGGG